VKTVSYGHNLLGTFRQLAKIAKMLTNAQPLRPRTVCRQSGSYRDVLASREDTRLASLGALGVRVATHDPVWHSSVIAITSEPLGETTRLAQFSLAQVN
jgi:hypothetical protein